MTDPLDRLADLAASGTPPLAPASLVRARGEQRRRTARALAGTALGLALLTGTAFAVSAVTGSGTDSLGPAATPTPTVQATPTTDTPSPCATPTPERDVYVLCADSFPRADPTPAPLTADRLLQPSDLDEVLGGTWRQPYAATEEAYPVFQPCGPADFHGDTGLRVVLDRGTGPSVTTAVLRYSTAAEAGDALQQLRDEVETCPPYEEDSGEGTVDVVPHPEVEGGTTTVYAQRTGGGSSPSTWLVVRARESLALVGVIGGVTPDQLGRLTERAMDRARCGAARCKTAEDVPPPAELQHGGTAWAVALAVTRTADDPRLAQAVRDADAAGYQATATAVDCDEGFREGLGLDAEGEYHHVSLYFATAEQAERFVRAFEPGVVGTVEVRTFCMD